MYPDPGVQCSCLVSHYPSSLPLPHVQTLHLPQRRPAPTHPSHRCEWAGLVPLETQNNISLPSYLLALLLSRWVCLPVLSRYLASPRSTLVSLLSVTCYITMVRTQPYMYVIFSPCLHLHRSHGCSQLPPASALPGAGHSSCVAILRSLRPPS